MDGTLLPAANRGVKKCIHAGNKAPRRKQRGINCAFTIRWLSASLRPKGRGIKPAEIKTFTAKSFGDDLLLVRRL